MTDQTSPTELTITRPDDWHLHVREGALLKSVVPDTARQFNRAIIMPNLSPPVATVSRALTYRDEILQAVPKGCDFTPLMTLYLTEQTTVAEIEAAAACPHVYAVKLYPAGATTNAASGVRDIKKVYPVIEAMEKHNLPLLMHGEVVDSEIDVFDREAVFIERHLSPLVRNFPSLRMVMEHITTESAVAFVRSSPPNLAATITAHHLLLNRNAMFEGGLRPHHYCLPLIKRERHRQALVQAATSGESKFFLGTDSAPHPKGAKEAECGCAGIYTARDALGFYAEVFDQANALDRLEGFASFYGADFYQLPRNTQTIRLVRQAVDVPDSLDFGGEIGVPLRAGGQVAWSVAA
ncbi:MAG TPA: dihydroorotase [Wenzhouxiangella sp.]